MADERFGGMLIFCVTFLGIFFLLLAVFPTEFFSLQSDYSLAPYDAANRDYWSKEDLENTRWAIYHNVSVGSGEEYDFTALNESVDYIFQVDWWNYVTEGITFRHQTWGGYLWGVLPARYDSMKVMDIPESAVIYGDPGSGNIFYASVVTRDFLVNYWDNTKNVTRLRPVQCEHITITAWIRDPNQTRNDIGAAWDEGTLYVELGFGFDDFVVALNSYDMIGRLLTFQSPEIFGLTGVAATIINTIIALPVWSCIAYLVYRLVLMAIPFVGD